MVIQKEHNKIGGLCSQPKPTHIGHSQQPPRNGHCFRQDRPRAQLISSRAPTRLLLSATYFTSARFHERATSGCEPSGSSRPVYSGQQHCSLHGTGLPGERHARASRSAQPLTGDRGRHSDRHQRRRHPSVPSAVHPTTWPSGTLNQCPQGATSSCPLSGHTIEIDG